MHKRVMEIQTGSKPRKRRSTIAIGLLWGLTLPGIASADICGCAGHPDSLGDFDSTDAATWPAGSEQNGAVLTIPLPQDGVLVFDSAVFGNLPGYLDGNAKTIRFAESGPVRRNLPVRILVAGRRDDWNKHND